MHCNAKAVRPFNTKEEGGGEAVQMWCTDISFLHKQNKHEKYEMKS